MTKAEFEGQTIIPSVELRFSMAVAEFIMLSAEVYVQSLNLNAQSEDIGAQLEVIDIDAFVSDNTFTKLKESIAEVGVSAQHMGASAMGRTFERMGTLEFKVVPTIEKDSPNTSHSADSETEETEYFEATGFMGFNEGNAIFTNSEGARLEIPADKFAIFVN